MAYNMSKPRVFVVQRQKKIDVANGALVDKFDVAPAERFGELVYLLGPSAKPWTASVIPELREALRGYDGERDWLVLVGSPVLIGYAMTFAALAGGGKVRVLQWHGRDRDYTPVLGEGLVYS